PLVTAMETLHANTITATSRNKTIFFMVSSYNVRTLSGTVKFDPNVRSIPLSQLICQYIFIIILRICCFEELLSQSRQISALLDAKYAFLKQHFKNHTLYHPLKLMDFQLLMHTDCFFLENLTHFLNNSDYYR
ncbi:MAG: hypothetical protein IJT77_06915, partial [Clostridia bacterium]|nr:hypothetical protein [Clostridia bacterium]